MAIDQRAVAVLDRSAKGTLDAPGRRVKQKARLNREILSAAFGMAHQMLSCKAAEAGTTLRLANTRHLKPSQRCAQCWEHVCPHARHALV